MFILIEENYGKKINQKLYSRLNNKVILLLLPNLTISIMYFLLYLIAGLCYEIKQRLLLEYSGIKT